MVRVALIQELRGEGTADLAESQMAESQSEVRRIIESEGGRPYDVFWYEPFSNSEYGSRMLRMVAIFAVRSQYPVVRGPQISLERYVRRPDVDEREMPESLGPEDMVGAILEAMGRSGRFLALEAERWSKLVDFHFVDEGTAEGARDDEV